MSVVQNTASFSAENTPSSLPSTASVQTVSAANASVQSTALSLTAIYVGKGDAILLTYPNGKHVLIDAGGDYTARTSVIPYLLQKGITHLDAIVCTHEHWDHIDGLTELLKDGRFTVDEAYDSGFPITNAFQTANYSERTAVDKYLTQLFPIVDNFQMDNNAERASIDHYLTQLEDRQVKRMIVKAGDTIDVGRDGSSQTDTATFVLSPNTALTASLHRGAKEGGSIENATNENSLVLQIEYGQVHFLLAGDTGLPGSSYANAAMLADPVQRTHLSSDVLKLGHHGQRTPDNAFYSVVKPRYVIMTFGPTLETSELYCEGLHEGTQNFDYFKDKLWSTCEKSIITVTSNGTRDSIHVRSEACSIQWCCCQCVNGQPS